MTTFKLKTEIGSEDTWVQLLEELKSGSLGAGEGINRLLERLAVNDDALFGAVQATANSFLTGGTTWSYAGNTLTWSGQFQVRWAEMGTAVVSNVVAGGSQAFPDDGGVAYLVLDKTSDGATVTVSYAASMTALRTVMVGAQTRADIFLLAFRSGSTVIFADGLRLQQNHSLTLERGRDSQYALQSEFTEVQRRQGQNHNLRLIGGGTLQWSVGAPTGTWTWDADLHVMVSGPEPAAGTDQSADYVIAAGNEDLEPGEVLYVDLSTRDPGTGGVGTGPTVLRPVVAYATAFAAVGSLRDKLVIAYYHSTDSRLYLMNGQSLGDGDTAVLGGAATGLQWRYADHGPNPAEQLLDLGNTYPVGSGALMVFRNGVKQKASSAVWSGAWPGGSLTGTIAVDDDYLEYDDGTGSGTQILWVRDILPGDRDGDENTSLVTRWSGDTDPLDGTTDGNANDPERSWPGDGDWVEAFIGVQGDGPSPVESIGVMGGDPADRLDGHVELEGGTGIVVEYDSGRIRIRTSVSGGHVVSLEVDGGGAGAQGGSLVLKTGAGLEVDDSTAGELLFNLTARLRDIVGLSENIENSVEALHDPSSTNAALTANAVEALQGFDVVWSPGSTLVRAAGGSLNRAGLTSQHATTATNNVLEGSTADPHYGGPPVVNNWIYAYAAHDGAEPEILWSADAPDRSVGYGHHPSSSQHAFLASAWFDGTGNLYPFAKQRGTVTLGRELDVSPNFSAAIGTPSAGFAWQPVTPSLPLTAGAVVRLRMRIEANDPVADRGNLMPLYVRATGAPGYRRFTSVMGSQRTEDGSRVDEDFVEFEFEAVLDGNGAFEISVPDTLYTGSPDVYLVGYDEPTASAAAAARSA